MPPSEPPRSSRSKKRKPRPAQPPSSTARQGAAFGSRPARPLPKPAPAPRAPRPQAPTPQQVRNARAQRAAIVSSAKAVDRGAYKQKTVKQRRQILKAAKATPVAQRTAAQRAALSVHHERQAGDVAARQRTGLTEGQGRALSARAYQYVDQGNAVAKAAKAADEAAAKAARKRESEKPIKVGGVSTHIRPGIIKAAVNAAVEAQPIGKVAKTVLGGGRQKQLQAPALAALDQTTRAGNAVRTSLKYDIKRGGVKEAFIGFHAPGSKAAKERHRALSRGFSLKERTSGADVLKAAGVKNKAVRAVAGFGVDVATDTATTPGFGVGGAAAREGEKVAARVVSKSAPAIRAAEKEAARQAAKAGAKRGARRAAAKAAGHKARAAAQARGRQAASEIGDVPLAVRRSEVAHKHLTDATTSGASSARIRDLKRAADKAEKNVKRARRNAPRVNQGLTVRALGREVPGVRVATAAAARGGRKVLKRAPARTVEASRIDREFLQAERSARATRNEGQARAVRVATQARHNLKDHEFEKVAIALDRGDIGSLTPSWKKALKEAKGDKTAARKIMEKDHSDELRLADAAHRIKGSLSHGYQQARRAGVTKSRRPEDFLTESDLGKLQKTVKSQRAETREAVRRSQKQEAASGATAQLRETEAGLRAQGATKVAQVKAVVRARDAHAAAKRRLRVELAKPVTKRRGVPKLELDVQRTRSEWQNARAAAVPAKTGLSGAAALRYERHAGTTAYHQQRRAAVEAIPVRGRGAGVPLDESHVAWLKRVRRHAQRHDLPLLKKRVDKLLAKAPKDVARGYFPREYEERALKTLGLSERKEFEGAKAVRGGQRRSAKTPTAGFARTDVRPLDIVQKELRDAGKPEFTTHVPLAAATHVREMARAASEAGFARDLAHRFGRKISHPSQLQEGESLYKLGTTGSKGYGLHPARSIPKTGKSGGQYIALKDDVVNRMQHEIESVPRVDSKVVRAWDKTTAGFKTLAISNPAFYIRNAIGDITRLAEMPGNPIRNIANLHQGVQGVRAVRQAERVDQAAGKVLKSVPLDQTIKVAGQKIPAREFVNRARSHGLIDAGFHGREQAELFHPERAFGDIRGGSRKGEMIRALHKPLTIDRENATRLAAFKAGLDMGMSDSEAADLAHKFFVDYGRLSPAERIYARRALPFYTWTARSLPVTVKNWAQNPVRYANLEMAREEWNQAVTGLSEDDIRSQMSPGTQRQIPFVIPLGHGRFAAVSASWPANLLNLVPTGLGKKAVVGYGNESLKTTAGLLHPGLRDFIELTTGRNPVTRREVESPYGPLTAAPDWVKYLPPSLKREFEVTDKYTDSRTGKKTLAWRGWADWVWRQVPGAPQQLSAAAEGGRPGQSPGAAATIAGLLGARVDDMGPEVAKYSEKMKLGKRSADITKRLKFLHDGHGVDRDHPNAEYRRLRAEQNAINQKLHPRKSTGGSDATLSPSDIGLGPSSSKLTPEDIGLGG